MRDFLRLSKWTFTNDLISPFVEIILLILVVLAASSVAMTVTAVSNIYTTLTWNTIYIIIILVGIAGMRSFSMGLERGELTRQMMTLRLSRLKFAFYKWLSLYLLFVLFLLAVDLVVFFEYLAYLPSTTVYGTLAGSAPLYAWGIMVGEQLLLLFFLNSLSLVFSFGAKRSSVSMLLFLAYSLLNTQLYALAPSLSGFFQLGYGDYQIASKLSNFVFITSLHYPSTLGLDFYGGLLYRAAGGLICLAISIFLFTRMDLD